MPDSPKPPQSEDEEKPRASFTDDDRDFPLPHESRSWITGATAKTTALRFDSNSLPSSESDKPTEKSDVDKAVESIETKRVQSPEEQRAIISEERTRDRNKWVQLGDPDRIRQLREEELLGKREKLLAREEELHRQRHKPRPFSVTQAMFDESDLRRREELVAKEEALRSGDKTSPPSPSSVIGLGGDTPPPPDKSWIDGVLESPVFAGVLAMIALAIGFSPRASTLATWVCLAVAWLLLIRMVYMLDQVRIKSRGQRLKITGWAGGIGLAVLGTFGLWLSQPLKSAIASAVQQNATTQATPSPSPTTSQRVFEGFKSIYDKDLSESLGTPGEVQTLEVCYIAHHERATVIWNENTHEFYLLKPKPSGTWTTNSDHITDKSCDWFHDDANAKRFGPVPSGLFPPWAGVARGWQYDPEHWKWIGWRGWDCNYTNSITHLQKFQNGMVIGLFRYAENYEKQPVVYVLMSDGKWEERTVNNQTAPPCEEPIPSPQCGAHR